MYIQTHTLPTPKPQQQLPGKSADAGAQFDERRLATAPSWRSHDEGPSLHLVERPHGLAKDVPIFVFQIGPTRKPLHALVPYRAAAVRMRIGRQEDLYSGPILGG